MSSFKEVGCSTSLCICFGRESHRYPGKDGRRLVFNRSSEGKWSKSNLQHEQQSTESLSSTENPIRKWSLSEMATFQGGTTWGFISLGLRGTALVVLHSWIGRKHAFRCQPDFAGCHIRLPSGMQNSRGKARLQGISDAGTCKSRSMSCV